MEIPLVILKERKETQARAEDMETVLDGPRKVDVREEIFVSEQMKGGR